MLCEAWRGGWVSSSIGIVPRPGDRVQYTRLGFFIVMRSLCDLQTLPATCARRKRTCRWVDGLMAMGTRLG